MVVDRVLPAEVLDDRLYALEVVAGQAREQMVLYLVVEAAVHEVGDWVCAHVL